MAIQRANGVLVGVQKQPIIFSGSDLIVPLPMGGVPRKAAHALVKAGNHTTVKNIFYFINHELTKNHENMIFLAMHDLKIIQRWYQGVHFEVEPFNAIPLGIGRVVF
jgi:hypothetical protein